MEASDEFLCYFFTPLESNHLPWMDGQEIQIFLLDIKDY